MLYWIAEQLGFPGILNLIRYLSFRTGAAVATALLLGLIIGPKFIGWLRVRQGKGQPIRSDGPQSHLAKRGTPTMGGLMILTSLMISLFLWMNLSNPLVWACMPEALAWAHIVIARAGASTIAELTAAGRPAILVPLPSATDDHQTANAREITNAGGARTISQRAFTATELAKQIQKLGLDAQGLENAATRAKSVGRPHAASDLADLVESIHAPTAPIKVRRAAIQGRLAHA